MAEDSNFEPGSAGRSLLDGLLRRASKVAGGTIDLALDFAATGAMNGDAWVRDLLKSSASPERLAAMADAGRFLRDARETAGLSLGEVADSLGLSDDSVLEGAEKGETLLPIDVIFRAASLLARHDPIPFLIKFFRSYNPQLESTLEQWGVMAIPKNYERERRFLNLYRQHDFLRNLDDSAHQRFIEYMDASTRLVVEVMEREAEAQPAQARSKARKTARRTAKKATRKTTRNTTENNSVNTFENTHKAETPKEGDSLDRKRSPSRAGRQAAPNPDRKSNADATTSRPKGSRVRKGSKANNGNKESKEREQGGEASTASASSASPDRSRSKRDSTVASDAPRARPVVRKVKPRKSA
ncbi:MAG: helix-turn-helix transcriptional regulator [Pseudomonadota bacterium]